MYPDSPDRRSRPLSESFELTGAPHVLADHERLRLRVCEEEIERREAASMRKGRPLREIRESRLYRETHPTWSAYVKDRWSMSRVSADRYVSAVEIADELEAVRLPAPRNEKQARPLTRLAPEDRIRVALRVREEGGFREVWARRVEEIAVEIAPRPCKVVEARWADLVVVTRGGRVGPSMRARGVLMRALGTMGAAADAVQALGPHAVEDIVRGMSRDEVQTARAALKAVARLGVRVERALAHHHGAEDHGQQELPLAV